MHFGAQSKKHLGEWFKKLHKAGEETNLDVSLLLSKMFVECPVLLPVEFSSTDPSSREVM